jgi:hypothetical protein
MEQNKLVEELKADYRDVFSTVKGKKVLHDIMLSGVMERSAWDKDPLVMSALVAKQDFARHIAQMASPIVEKQEKPVKAKK